METQTIINIIFAVAFVGYVVWQRNPTFNQITCKGWKVMDAGGTERITAFTTEDKDEDKSNGRSIVNVVRNAGVELNDQNGRPRIMARMIDETAIVQICHMNWIMAAIHSDGSATIKFIGKDGQGIEMGIDADGIVYLPTKYETPPTKP